jgi:hypothetical protein
MANLDRIYTNLQHRADENLKLDIENVFKTFKPLKAKWIYTQILESVSDVFENYSFDFSETLNNMQPYVVLAYEFEVSYDNKLIC